MDNLLESVDLGNYVLVQDVVKRRRWVVEVVKSCPRKFDVQFNKNTVIAFGRKDGKSTTTNKAYHNLRVSYIPEHRVQSLLEEINKENERVDCVSRINSINWVNLDMPTLRKVVAFLDSEFIL
jgi:hypothetical protein